MDTFSNSTVLVVDDESDIRRIIIDFIEPLEVVTVEAANGVEALAVLAMRPVSLMITDINMPRMNGMELLKEVNAKYPQLTTLIISAHGDKENLHEALKLHVFDFIDKPFTADILLRRVTNALKHGSQKDLINLALKNYLIQNFKGFNAASFEKMNAVEKNNVLQMAASMLNLQDLNRDDEKKD